MAGVLQGRGEVRVADGPTSPPREEENPPVCSPRGPCGVRETSTECSRLEEPDSEKRRRRLATGALGPGAGGCWSRGLNVQCEGPCALEVTRTARSPSPGDRTPFFKLGDQLLNAFSSQETPLCEGRC